MSTSFERFPSIARWHRDVIITEKLDGSNAQVAILPVEELIGGDEPFILARTFMTYERNGETESGFVAMLAGSRKRWIKPNTPDDKGADNYGFAEWVTENSSQLWALGPGRHFGEWWGRGIQRNYGLAERRFSMFIEPRHGERPELVDIVPTLYAGPLLGATAPDVDVSKLRLTHPALHDAWVGGRPIENVIDALKVYGSAAAPGFMNPEGVMVWHAAGRQTFKVTCENDHKPKGA